MRENSLLGHCWQMRMKKAKPDAISSMLSNGSSPWHILSPKPFPHIVLRALVGMGQSQGS